MSKIFRILIISILSSIIVFLNVIFLYARGKKDTGVKFPANQPKNGNFNHPVADEIVDVSPPGFCWWRAGERGLVTYRLRIRDNENKEIYASPLLDEPAHVPQIVLPAGVYSWTVEAINTDGEISDTRPVSRFTISDNAVSLPWVAPHELLSRVPKDHPRLLFPKKTLPEIQKLLYTDLRISFTNLKAAADKALTIPLVEKPDFNKFEGKKQYAAKRTAYRESYQKVGKAYLDGMVPLALTYLFTNEKKYGEAAKAHILHLLDWNVDGVMSVQDPRFDEVGLRIARALPQGYDWCYNLFTQQERRDVENMLVKLGNKLLERMKTRDFLNTSAESHDGRVPGYLLEFAIALAERPESEAWFNYGMTAVLTVFPHWAGNDGGWAEGVNYALTYNDLFITPLQSVYLATGYDLWQKPFFRKFPDFLIYCISPKAEITPFGDQEHLGIVGRTDKLCSMLLFYALRNKDAGMRWWVDLLGKGEQDSTMDGSSAIRSMILPDTIKRVAPKNIAQDQVFFGVGWAALHSDLTNVDQDLLVLFKSSPFGPVSHSHLDQNSFAMLKGGKALAIPAGERYPQHGSPFHTQYTRQTVAHNALLINGNGQIDRQEKANGKLIDFKSLPHIGYAAGEAHRAYGSPVTRYVRYILLIRPSLVLVVDDLDASEPVQVDWLMHAKEQFDFNEQEQTFISHRSGEFMKVYLFTLAGFHFSQTDAWPIDPKQDYPMVKTDPPAKQWHFTARAREQNSRLRIAAIMNVADKEEYSQVDIRRSVENTVEINAIFPTFGEVNAHLDLSCNGSVSTKPIIEIHYQPQKGKDECLIIP